MKRLSPKVVDIIREHKTNDPDKLAALIGIEVYYENVHSETFQGASFTYKNRRLIVINEKFDWNHRKVILAHELGHTLLQNTDGLDFSGSHVITEEAINKDELEANKFAFLLISHTCMRNCPDMIDGIRDEQLLTIESTEKLLEQFSVFPCFAAGRENVM